MKHLRSGSKFIILSLLLLFMFSFIFTQPVLSEEIDYLILELDGIYQSIIISHYENKTETGNKSNDFPIESFAGINDELNQYETSGYSTSSVTVPTVITGDPNYDNITSNSAIIVGYIVSNGGASINLRGFGWGISRIDENLVNDFEHDVYISGNAFGYNLTNLKPNTTYRYIAFASNSQGSGLGEIKTFTTKPSCSVSRPTTPSGQGTGNTNITYSYSTGGSGCAAGHSVQYRFDWDDGTYSSWSSSSSASKKWTTPGTYYVTAQARCASNTSVTSSWSLSRTVTISSPIVTPTVITIDPNYDVITSTEAGIIGQIINDGGAAVSIRAFAWGENSIEENLVNDIEDNFNINGSYFGYALTGLKPNTKYYYAAFACNSAGWGQGDIKIFTTKPAPSNKFSSGDWVLTTADGVRIRPEPGLDNTYIKTLPSGSVAQVISHSQNGVYMDGYHWWYLELLADGQRGWIAENYLAATTTPCSVSKPNLPTGADSGHTNYSYTYSTGGSTCSSGHNVQYRFDWGDGTLSSWGSSISATKSWSVAGEYQIKAQARCATNTSVTSSWSTGHIVIISDEPSDPIPLVLTAPIIDDAVDSDSAIIVGGIYNDSLGPILQRAFHWGPNTSVNNIEYDIFLLDDYPNLFFFKITGLNPNTTYYYKAAVRNNAGWGFGEIESFTTKAPTPGCIINTPVQPTGPDSGYTNASYQYTTGGASCSGGHSLQYQFWWRKVGGSWNSNGWNSSSSTTLNFDESGTYEIDVRARCSQNNTVTSSYSSKKIVSISSPASCIVSKPDNPSGKITGAINTTYTYSTGGSNCEGGHGVEYRFWWTKEGSGTYQVSDWSSTAGTNIKFDEPGTYLIDAQARCANNTSVRSDYSDCLIVIITGQYTIAVNADPTAGGSVIGGNEYDHGSSVTVEATPSSGYEFVNWTENGKEVHKNARYTFTATSNRNLTAHFRRVEPVEDWRVMVNVTGVYVRVEAGSQEAKVMPYAMIKHSRGRVIEGPVEAEGYKWVKVDYDMGIKGWSVLQDLDSGLFWLVEEPNPPFEPKDFPERADNAIRWAEQWHSNNPGSMIYYGLCMRFVANAFQGVAGQSAGMNAIDGAINYYRFDQQYGGWENAPRGALIYFDRVHKDIYDGFDGNPYGHVGIHIGNGRMIHAHGSVKIENISSFLQAKHQGIGRYIGWAYPPPPEVWSPLKASAYTYMSEKHPNVITDFEHLDKINPRQVTDQIVYTVPGDTIANSNDNLEDYLASGSSNNSAHGDNNIVFVYNWLSGEMRFSIYDPGGELYTEISSDTPPISIEIKNAMAGEWSVVASADDVIQDESNFVVLAGQEGLQGTGADLSALIITPGTLNPPFNPGTINYTVDVALGVETIDIIANLSNPNATMTIAGEPVNSGEATSVALGDPGTSTVIDIVVTAEDSINQKTYTLTVNRLDSDQSFTDVSTDHPFFKEIEALVISGITAGYKDGTFRPSNPVTRMAMAAFLVRCLDLGQEYTVPDQPTFSDVPLGHPFFEEIELLAASGIADGYEDGTFRPSANVTRMAMAAFLVRGFELDQSYDAPDQPTFTDVLSDHTFSGEIELLAASGITTGWPDGTFRPTQAVTRQAMAAFLFRALERNNMSNPD